MVSIHIIKVHIYISDHTISSLSQKMALSSVSGMSAGFLTASLGLLQLLFSDHILLLHMNCGRWLGVLSAEGEPVGVNLICSNFQLVMQKSGSTYISVSYLTYLSIKDKIMGLDINAFSDLFFLGAGLLA